MKKDFEGVRALVAALLVDFSSYANKIEDPILIGGQYPPDKMTNLILNFCYDRGIQLSNPDMDTWDEVVQGKFLTKTQTHKPVHRMRFKNA